MIGMSAERTLVELCVEVTGSKLDREFDASISLFDLGLTEAQVPLLCRRIKKEMGVSVSAEDILATQEIGAIAALLNDSATLRPATSSASRSNKALKWLSVALLLPSVASAKVELDAHGCVKNFDPTADYFSPKHRAMMSSTGLVPSTVTFATDFSIEYFHTFKIVRNLKTSKVYVLHQCGAGAAPLAAALPADAVSAPVFTVPVQSWSTSGTTALAFMEELGLMNKATLIDPTYASSSCLLKLSAPGCGVVTSLANGWPSGEHSTYSYAVRNSTSTLHLEGGSYSSRDVDFTATSDPGVLARAEWIKYLAAFFNLEPHANRVFNNIKAEFDQTKALTAAAIAGGVVAPKVLWVSTASTGQYGSPAQISTASYKMDFVKAAGGVTPAVADLALHCKKNRPMYGNAADSAVSAEDIASGYVNAWTCTDAGLKAVLAGIDVVIDETYHSDNTYTNDMFMAKLNFSSAETAAVYPFLNKALRTDRLMVQSNAAGYATYGTAWFEDAIPRADITVDDFAFYLHPTLMPSTYKPRFIRNIAAGETITLATAAQCTDPYATCPGETAPPKPPTELNSCLFSTCVVAAAPNPFELDAQGCLKSFDPTADYFSPEHRAMMSSTGSVPSTVTFATDFSIEYFHTFKVLRHLSTSKVYVLHQCGAGAGPPAADLPADAVSAPVFTVPIQSWSTAGTTSLAFMELLGLINKAALIDPSYASSSCLLKLAGCGVINGLANGWPSGEFSTFAYAARNSTSTLHFEGGSYSGVEVDFAATSDPSALGRAEWIKYLAAFFNLEPHANRVFAGIKAEYEKTQALTTAAVAGGVVAPKVLWINTATTGQWGAPASISTASYKMDHVKAAGGVTPTAAELALHCTKQGSTQWSSGTSAVSAADIALGYVNVFSCTDAGLKAVLAGIDVVIDETYHSDNTYTNDMFVTKLNFSSAETAAVYPFLNKALRFDRLMVQSNAQGYATYGTAAFEDMIPRADIVADDLASYLHPTLVPSTYKPRFFRNIAAGETITLSTGAECDDPYATCPGETAPPKPPMELNYCSGALCLLAAPPSPPPPPPTQPPPPPPSPSPEMPGTSLVAMEAEVFEISVTAAGTVETFNKAGYETNMRTYLGCKAPLCQVAIAVTAGSVKVVATVTDTTSTAVAAAKKLTTDSTAALSTALGVTVEATPTVSAATKTKVTIPVAPPPPAAAAGDDDNSAAGIVGGILGAVTFCLLVFVCYMASREKKGKPVFSAVLVDKIAPA